MGRRERKYPYALSVFRKLSRSRIGKGGLEGGYLEIWGTLSLGWGYCHGSYALYLSASWQGECRCSKKAQFLVTLKCLPVSTVLNVDPFYPLRGRGSVNIG